MVTSVVGSEAFQANHLVTDAEYNKDLNLMNILRREPFISISLEKIRTMNAANYPLYKNWIRKLQRDTAGCQVSKKGSNPGTRRIIEQSLKQIQTDANSNTISFQRAKNRGKFNSITKSSSLTKSGTKINHSVYGEEYKISNVSAISCSPDKNSTPHSSQVNAYYKLKKSGDNETHTFIHIDNE